MLKSNVGRKGGINLARSLAGGGVNLQKGYFTETTSINAGTDYTKTIALDRTDYKTAIIRFCDPTDYIRGGIVIASTTADDATSFYSMHDLAPYSGAGNRRVLSALSPLNTNGYGIGLSGHKDIALVHVYINAGNLVFLYRNNDGGSARALNISCQWEVIG